MSRWTIIHRGVPIAAVDAAADQLGAVAVEPLPAFDALRPSLPSTWHDTSAGHGAPDEPRNSAATVPDALELQDERGDAVPTTRLELVATGPQSAVAFISLDTAAARVGAPVQVRPRGAADAAPEA